MRSTTSTSSDDPFDYLDDTYTDTTPQGPPQGLPLEIHGTMLSD